MYVNSSAGLNRPYKVDGEFLRTPHSGMVREKVTAGSTTTQDLDSEGWAASLETRKNELNYGVPFFRIRNPAAVDTERYAKCQVLAGFSSAFTSVLH